MVLTDFGTADQKRFNPPAGDPLLAEAFIHIQRIQPSLWKPKGSGDRIQLSQRHWFRRIPVENRTETAAVQTGNLGKRSEIMARAGQMLLNF
ncbi:hypothetical protein D3C74_327120 [compost metagenome]